MAESDSLPKALESVSKQHEDSVVIELGTDRLIRWLGIYAIASLAAVAKIWEFATSGIACYPTTSPSHVQSHFIAFASSYCWEIQESGDALNKTCSQALRNNVTLSRDPAGLKLFITLLPYVMLGKAILFAIPIALWHFRVGAPLMGHLKFMQLLLNEIFEKVRTVPTGRPNNKAYDAGCRTLDGNRLWDRLNEDQSSSVEEKQSTEGTAQGPKVERSQSGERLTRIETEVGTVLLKSQRKKRNRFGSNFTLRRCTSAKWSFTGGMLDRHLFSIFCYENFASLHQLPYILSVFLLTEFEESKLGKKPLNKALVELWCHEKNLTNTFLVKRYLLKHLATALLAACSLVGMITCFFAGNVYSDVVNAKTFGCEIPFYHPCLLCSIKRVSDVIVLLVLDQIATVTVLLLSLYKVRDIRNSVALNKCHFFEDLRRTSNLALEMARST